MVSPELLWGAAIAAEEEVFITGNKELLNLGVRRVSRFSRHPSSGKNWRPNNSTEPGAANPAAHAELLRFPLSLLSLGVVEPTNLWNRTLSSNKGHKGQERFTREC